MQFTLNKNKLKLYSLWSAILLVALFLQGCGVEDPEEEINTWVFSGHVVDGYTEEVLENVSIHYQAKVDGQDLVKTNELGGFYINNLPFGEKSFLFEATSDSTSNSQSTNSQAQSYTSRLVVVSSWGGSVAPEGEVGDASQVIKLYPLTGAVTGKLLLKKPYNEHYFPAANVLLHLTYNGNDLENASPNSSTAETDSNGNFTFSGLPLASGAEIEVSEIYQDGSVYHHDNIPVSQLFPNRTVNLGSIYLELKDSSKVTSGGIVSNVLSQDGYGLPNVPVNTELYYVLPLAINPQTVTVEISGDSVELDVSVSGDTVFAKPVQNFGYGRSISVVLTGESSEGNYFQYTFGGTKAFQTAKGVHVLASNTWDGSGRGTKNFPVEQQMFYVLSATPDSNNIVAYITGGGDPETHVSISGDTVFVYPTRQLEYNSQITVELQGTTTQGQEIQINLDGSHTFQTERSLYPIASNTWSGSGSPAQNFDLYGSMWVRFSEVLSTDLSQIQWIDEGSPNRIFGRGSLKNATVRVNEDTLFVQPDTRLALDYGEEVSFRVRVASQENKFSDTLTFSVYLKESDYHLVWSNTRDALGQIRDDLDVLDSIVLVTSVPVQAVTGMSRADSGAAPPDLNLNQITIRGDTIIYKPNLSYSVNTLYSLDFDVTFAADGNIGGGSVTQKDVFPVYWRTQEGVSIVSVDNRSGDRFRTFDVMNDQFLVVFSEAIDTNSTTRVPFNVNMEDVNGFIIATDVSWDASLTQATVQILDTLPTANYNTSPAYTENAIGTRAISNVSFDLTTVNGEDVFRLAPANGNLEIHTEVGLAPIQTNLLQGHRENTEVLYTTTPVNDFAVADNIQITFNLNLDVATMNRFGMGSYAGLLDGETNLSVPVTVSVDNNKTLVLDPIQNLDVGKSYKVWIRNIPAATISGARAIANHGGMYSGRAEEQQLFNTVFYTASPNISNLEAEVEHAAPTLSGIGNPRLALSPGFAYDVIGGTANANSATQLKFLIAEAAWNANHGDSVEGYEVQFQRRSRNGNITGWYDYPDRIPAVDWSLALAGSRYTRDASIQPSQSSDFNLLSVSDADGFGSFYQNGSNLFNDSTQINIRIRPYVGTGNPGRDEVGQWSDSIVFVDNVAPCDSDFVTASHCNNLSRGGVQVVENINFDNSSGLAANTEGYIDIRFPEDMNPQGPSPEITFFYGPFDGNSASDPTEELTVLSQSGWVDARRYRVFVSVPVFDYTHGGSGDGAYYNVSVADVQDGSRIAIHTYGSNGPTASSSISAVGRPNRSSATSGQSPGSSSVVQGFVECN
jgi:hypothetical protein